MKKSILSLATLAALSFNVSAAQVASTDSSLYQPQNGYTKEQSATLLKKFDLDTYQLAEDVDVTRYSYLNASQFFTHATIKREGQVAELPVALDTSVANIKVDTHHGELTLDQWTEGYMDGVVIVHKGKVIYEKYPRMRDNDKHIWWSVSKSVVGTLVAMLESEGKLDVNKPIEIYIPELAKTAWAGTPVINILNMASGMTGLEADDPEAYTNQESAYGLFESSLGLVGETPITMDSTYEYIKTLSRQKPDGEKHEYTSVNTFVLSWLIEEITKKPYAEVVQERIWQHIGAEGDALLQTSPIGASSAHGAISSTLRDMARYGMLFTPSWNKLSDTQVVSNQVVKRLQTPTDLDLMKSGIAYDYFNDYVLGDLKATGYQWDIITSDNDIAKAGFHGQTLYISPEKDLVVVSFATNETYDTFMYARKLAKMLK